MCRVKFSSAFIGILIAAYSFTSCFVLPSASPKGTGFDEDQTTEVDQRPPDIALTPTECRIELVKMGIISPGEEITSFAISEDDQYLAAGTELGVHLYRVETLTEIWNRHTPYPISKVVFSPDSSRIALGFASRGQSKPDPVKNTLEIWEVLSSEPSHKLVGHSFMVTDITWSRDGLHLASSSAESVIIWNVETGILNDRWSDTDITAFGSPDLVEWSPDGQLLAIGTVGGRIVIWDIQEKAVVQVMDVYTRSISGVEKGINSMAWSTDSTRILVTNNFVRQDSPYGEVSIWSVITGRLEPIPDGAYHPELSAWSQNGKAIAIEILPDIVRLWDVYTGSILTTIHGEFSHSASATDAVLGSSGRLLTILNRDGALVVMSCSLEC